LLKLVNVSKYYRNGNAVVQALNKINVELFLGEFVCLTGESGSGKSTFLNVVSGLDQYEDGEIFYGNQETSHFTPSDWEQYRKNLISFVFQDYRIVDSLTVYQNVSLSLTIKRYPLLKRRARINDLLKRVGLFPLRNQKASHLSGGEKQRCSLARALASEAPILVCDEPTGNLDSESGKKIVELIAENAVGKLVIVVTHDAEIFAQAATRRIRLADGQIVEDVTVRPSDHHNDPLPVQHNRPILWHDYGIIATRMLFSTPKRSIFSLLIAIVLVLTFVVSMGDIAQLAEESTESNPNFPNSAPTRLVMAKWDGTGFSDDELTDIESLAGVRSVLHNSALLDEPLTFTSPDSGNPETGVLFASNQLATLNLFRGRLPSNPEEVVVSPGSGLELGETVQATLLGLDFEWTVVGWSRLASSENTVDFYVHEDFIEDPLLYWQMVADKRVWTLENSENDSLSLSGMEIDETTPLGTVVVNQSWVDTMTLEGFSWEEMDVLSVIEPYIGVRLTFPVELVIEADNASPILISTATLSALCGSEPRQISLITSGIDASDGIASRFSDTYRVIRPYDFQDSIEGILTTLIIIVRSLAMMLLFGVVYALSYVAFKNVLRTKAFDYAIFRSIGASISDIRRISTLEMILCMAFGALLVTGIYVAALQISTSIPPYFLFFRTIHYVALGGILLFLSLVLSRKLGKALFEKSVTQTVREA